MTLLYSDVEEMHQVRRLAIYVALLALGGAVGASCTTTKMGPVVDTEETKVERAGSASHEVDVVGASEEIGAVTLQAQTRPEYRVRRTDKHAKLERRDRTFGLATGTVGLVGIGLGASIVPECANADNFVECEEPGAREASWLMLGGAAAVAIGSMATNWAEQDTTYQETGEYVLGDERTEVEEGEPEMLEKESISVTIDGTTRRFETDDQGRVQVDMAEAFGVGSVETATPLVATVALPDQDHAESITLDPRDWMVPHARVEEAGPLRSAPRAQAEALRRVERGDELQIEDMRSDWFEVQQAGTVGWVPAADVEQFWAPSTRFDPNRLPRMTASVEFAEPTGNDRLDADGHAKAHVTLRNEGEGPARRARAQVDPGPEAHAHVDYPAALDFGRISAGQAKTQTLRITADRGVESKDIDLTFQFQEANGFAPPPIELQFETQEFIPPNLTIADVGIDDAGGRGVIEPGEVVDVTARIQNASQGPAEDVSAQVHFGEDVFAGPETRRSFNVGDLGPGEHRDVQFSLVTSQQAESVPVRVDLEEGYGEFGSEGVELPLAFDRPARQVTRVQVDGQEPDVSVRPSDDLTVDVEADVPPTDMDRPNAVAVVIGVRSYAAGGVPNVEYAQRDARLMREYLTRALGFSEENILPIDLEGRVTYAELRTLIRHRLPSYVTEETSEVFVYYSGHGAPSTGEERHPFLVPSDTDPNLVSEDNAYRLDHFYEDLASLGAESVTVVLDACFTGQARSGDMLIRQASPLVLSVENPLLAMGEATGFLASGPEQVANWYPEKGHGMFTYFFLKGLQGAADLEGDGTVTVGEMRRYLTDEQGGVPYWSRRLHQREQVPEVHAHDPDQVLIRFDE